MRAIITGSDGFVGPHLQSELESKGYSVFPLDVKEMDVTNYDQVYLTIRSIMPDYIFHLAGISYVPTSWQNPDMVLKVNTLGSLNIFNAVRAIGIDPVIQLAGSSEEYGLVYSYEIPVKEEQPLRPLSPYGVSKIGMDLLGYQYFKSYGMKIIRTRAFNHEGYGRPETFMPSGFAKQFVAFEMGLIDTVKHGNLEAKRDITDVRDMVRAYRLAVDKCEPGEAYNIGSGILYSGRDVIDKLKEITHLSPPLEEDPKRMRPSDVPILLSDSTKFKKKTKWQPKFTIEDTLKEELRYWEEQFGGEYL